MLQPQPYNTITHFEREAKSTRKLGVPKSGITAKRGGETIGRETSLVPPGKQRGLGHEAKKEALCYIFERSRGCGQDLETCHQLCGTLTTSFSRIPERGSPHAPSLLGLMSLCPSSNFTTPSCLFLVAHEIGVRPSSSSRSG